MSDNETNVTLFEILGTLSASEDYLEHFDPKALIGSLEGKVDSIHYIIEKMEATTAHLKSLAKPLTEKAKAIDNSRERLREYVRDTMLANEFESIPGNAFKASIATGHRKLKIESAREPTAHDFREHARFIKMQTVFSWDHAEIEKAFEANEKLPDLVQAYRVESKWVVFKPHVPAEIEPKKRSGKKK